MEDGIKLKTFRVELFFFFVALFVSFVSPAPPFCRPHTKRTLTRGGNAISKKKQTNKINKKKTKENRIRFRNGVCVCGLWFFFSSANQSPPYVFCSMYKRATMVPISTRSLTIKKKRRTRKRRRNDNFFYVVKVFFLLSLGDRMFRVTAFRSLGKTVFFVIFLAVYKKKWKKKRHLSFFYFFFWGEIVRVGLAGARLSWVTQRISATAIGARHWSVSAHLRWR